MTPGELRTLVAVMRELGVMRYEDGCIVVELGPTRSAPAAAPPVDAERMRKRQEAYDEALLFAAASGFPDEPDDEKDTMLEP